jgi:hypothetical protein
MRAYTFSIAPIDTHTGVHDFNEASGVYRTTQKLGSLGIKFSGSSLYKMNVNQRRYFDVEFIGGVKALIVLSCIS